jgi:hypothetical protein
MQVLKNRALQLKGNGTSIRESTFLNLGPYSFLKGTHSLNYLFLLVVQYLAELKHVRKLAVSFPRNQFCTGTCGEFACFYFEEASKLSRAKLQNRTNLKHDSRSYKTSFVYFIHFSGVVVISLILSSPAFCTWANYILYTVVFSPTWYAGL